MSAGNRILIQGGTVIDGNNSTGFQANVLIEGDRIAAVGKLDSI